MKRVNWLVNDDWEGIYLDGKIIEQGHVPFESDYRIGFLELAENENFTSEDVNIVYIDDTPLNEYLMETGGFPENLQNLPDWEAIVNSTGL